MAAPRMPGHTCPMIDKLKLRIENAYKMAESIDESADQEALRSLLSDIAHELNGEADVLEDIREANLGLRNCAEYWMSEAERLESESA